jgi:D-aminoacyl-tRNA deacylase
MRAVIQRVSKALVNVNKKKHAQIGEGLLIFLGIEDTDDAEDIVWLCNKIIQLRIFNDGHGIMNLSIQQINGEIMIISQFTLHASTKKGNRPSYIKASKPEIAKPIYQRFIQKLKQITNNNVETGIFGANMQIELLNNGPVTIIIDTKNKE